MKSFLSFDLPQLLLTSLKEMNFKEPTPIQDQAIPVALEGKDIIGSAQTGTGKTGAFSIPLVTRLINNQQEHALVMTPTRELAVQVLQFIDTLLGKKSKIKTALLIGGDSIYKQLNQLKARPRIVVGTPGRINDHLLRKTLNLYHTKFLVLDETDRMLDMGFSEQIDKIVEHLPEDRQTLLFSATLPKRIISLADSYLNDPVRIAVGSTVTPTEKIKQEVIYLREDEKYNQLKTQLDERPGSIIIFVKTKIGAEKIADRLRDDNYRASAIHGDLKQRNRERVISAFRSRKNRIMVATDVASRGLDIPHIEHVINYDLPQSPEDYIHRIGRTARAGSEGSALSLITPSDKSKWGMINRLINPQKESSNKPSKDGKEVKYNNKKRSFSNASRYNNKNDSDKSFKSSNNKNNSRRSSKPKTYKSAAQN